MRTMWRSLVLAALLAVGAAHGQSGMNGEIALTGKNAVVAKLVDFSADLFFIEYVYLAAPGRRFADVAAVDRPGVRIAVPRNASADVYLTRTLKSATLLRMC